MSAPHAVTPHLEALADRLHDQVIDMFRSTGIVILPDPQLETELRERIEHALLQAAQTE